MTLLFVLIIDAWCLLFLGTSIHLTSLNLWVEHNLYFSQYYLKKFDVKTNPMPLQQINASLDHNCL